MTESDFNSIEHLIERFPPDLIGEAVITGVGEIKEYMIEYGKPASSDCHSTSLWRRVRARLCTSRTGMLWASDRLFIRRSDGVHIGRLTNPNKDWVVLDTDVDDPPMGRRI
jgi:hypothetical protein